MNVSSSNTFCLKLPRVGLRLVVGLLAGVVLQDLYGGGDQQKRGVNSTSNGTNRRGGKWQRVNCSKVRNNKQELDIHHALQRGANDITIRMLVAQSANVNLKDGNRETPLHVAAKKGRAKVVEELLNSHARINVQDASERTPLHLAVEAGCNVAVEMLAARGAAVNEPDKAGQTPLHVAAAHGRMNVIATLLRNGAAVDVQDCHGRTPLRAAAGKGHEQAVEMLVQAGANLNLPDKHGKTPLQSAADHGKPKAVRILWAHGARNKSGSTSASKRADEWNHQDVINELRRPRARCKESAKNGGRVVHGA